MPHADDSRRLRSVMQIPRQHHRGFSYYLDAKLRYASDLLRHAPAQTDPRFRAMKELLPFDAKRLCATQRMQLSYTLAEICVDEDAPLLALTHLSTAYEIARERDDLPTMIHIGRSAGTIYRRFGNYDAAYDTYMETLSLLHELSYDRPDGHADANMEMEVLQRLVSCSLELGDFSASMAHQAESQRLLMAVASVRNDPARTASFLWNEATLAHRSGALVRAFQQTNAALAAYGSLRSTPIVELNIARLHSIRAEHAMDLVVTALALETPTEAQMPSQQARLWSVSTSQQELVKRFVTKEQYTPQKLLQTVEADAYEAQRIARKADVDDPVGEILGDMMRVRAERLAGQMGMRSTSLSHTIEQAHAVAQRAKWHGDAPLIGRTENMLGDTLLVAGKHDEARSHYRQAFAMLTEFAYPTYASVPNATLHAMGN